jgi:anti-sigma factor RsiW
MTCEHAHLVSLYHDGELPAGQRAGVEQHLAECDECREMLAELRAISRMVSASALRPMPEDFLSHLEENVDAANRDRGVLKIAGWLTSVAAAVLIASLLLWPMTRGGGDGSGTLADTGGRTTLAWQAAAVMPPADNRDDAVPETVQLAQWMASDLSVGDLSNPGERQ